jgi:hypothetical protein
MPSGKAIFASESDCGATPGCYSDSSTDTGFPSKFHAHYSSVHDGRLNTSASRHAREHEDNARSQGVHRTHGWLRKLSRSCTR